MFDDLQHIGQREGIKDGFEIVITISPLPEDVKAKIDLAVRKNYHG
jgi:hypothetical protein